MRGCRLFLVREWIRASCADGMWFPESSWGAVGEDHVSNLDGSVEIRLRRGTLIRGHDHPSGVRLVMAWPTTDPQPWQLALEEPRGSGGREPQPPRPVPEVPVVDGDRPAEADWFAAVPVDTSPGVRSRDCSLAVRGQWARLHCEGEAAALSNWKTFGGFGPRGLDHVTAVIGVSASYQLDFRLRRGGEAHGVLVRLGAAEGMVSIDYAWPFDAPRPTVLALAVVRP